MPKPYNKVSPEAITYLTSIVTDKRIWVGDAIDGDYHHDEMPEYGIFPPEVYIEVLNAEEISQIMKFANENNIPVTARGAGSGLSGGATCKCGGILISLMKMNRIIEVDTANMSITAEPGALLTEVAEAAEEVGLFYPPDPGERTASIGGTVITNAGGMRAVRYGVTRDYVRAIEAVLPDGEIVNFSSNVVKNTTGYDIKDLIIGSEGTLCICTKAILKLIPKPNCTQTLILPFRDVETCIDCVPKILQLPFIPTACEFLERELLDIVGNRLGKLFPVPDGEAVLIVMYDGSSQDELNQACDKAAEAALEAGAIDVLLANSAERIGSVWSVRAAILEGMKADSVSQEECDVVVPRAKIAEYVKTAKAVGRRYKIRIVPCGHAGDGNIHTEMLRDEGMTDKEWKEATHACLAELYDVSKKLGGQLSGEHGIGNGRIEFLEDFLGKRMCDLFRSIKLAFDPNLILNPEKIVTFD